MKRFEGTFQEYIDERAVRVPWSGCHLWMGIVNAGGYATSEVAERRYGSSMVHRALFQHLNGITLPRQIYVCHTCDTPSCVNPGHLFAGTPSDNAQDRKSKNRSAPKFGGHNGRAKLKASDLPEIRRLLADGKYQSDIAEMFSVTQTTISKVKVGASWGEL